MSSLQHSLSHSEALGQVLPPSLPPSHPSIRLSKRYLRESHSPASPGPCLTHNTHSVLGTPVPSAAQLLGGPLGEEAKAQRG